MDNEDLAEHLLDHAESPHHCGSCPHATHRGEVANPSCGDWVRIELQVSGNVIAEAWFQNRGCLISRAAASMLVETIEGKTAAEIAYWTPADMLRLFGTPLTSRRQVCCLLAYYALNRALGLSAVLKSAVHATAESSSSTA